MTKVRKLSDVTTVAEVLEIAVEFEREAHSFYVDLVPKVSKNVRWLVEELAREELGHVRLFSELAKNPEVQSHMSDKLARPTVDRKFSDAVQAPDLGDNPDDQAVLQYALSREQLAMEEYSELAANTEPGPLHDAFQFLANEEREHKAELEAIYYEIVHSGGV